MEPTRTRLLSRDDLDRFECAVPGCRARAENEPIYFHARCHRGAGLVARYERDDDPCFPAAAVGVVVLTCARCRREVARVVVGFRPPPPPP